MRVGLRQGNLVEAFVPQRKSRDGWLDEIDRLVDWRRLEVLFSDVYASRADRVPQRGVAGQLPSLFSGFGRWLVSRSCR
jgi:hypothetical protein